MPNQHSLAPESTRPIVAASPDGVRITVARNPRRRRRSADAAALAAAVAVTPRVSTRSTRPTVPTPDGFERLPGGDVRTIRVNKNWIIGGVGKPFVIVNTRTGKKFNAREVAYLGSIQMVAEEHTQRVVGCGGPRDLTNRTAYIRTSGAIAVKR